MMRARGERPLLLAVGRRGLRLEQQGKTGYTRGPRLALRPLPSSPASSSARRKQPVWDRPFGSFGWRLRRKQGWGSRRTTSRKERQSCNREGLSPLSISLRLARGAGRGQARPGQARREPRAWETEGEKSFFSLFAEGRKGGKKNKVSSSSPSSSSSSQALMLKSALAIFHFDISRSDSLILMGNEAMRMRMRVRGAWGSPESVLGVPNLTRRGEGEPQGDFEGEEWGEEAAGFGGCSERAGRRGRMGHRTRRAQGRACCEARRKRPK